MLSAIRQCSAGCLKGPVKVAGNSIDGRASITGRAIGRSLAAGTKGGVRGRGVAAFDLLDEDIEERFVKGSGPGGQKINKVRNCVQLTHIPSGVSVSCQDSRELHANRHIARKRLKEKVEFQLKGDDSKYGRRINKIRTKKARSQRKSRLKHQGGDDNEVPKWSRVGTPGYLCPWMLWVYWPLLALPHRFRSMEFRGSADEKPVFLNVKLKAGSPTGLCLVRAIGGQSSYFFVFCANGFYGRQAQAVCALVVRTSFR